jgi:hypothetical protein
MPRSQAHVHRADPVLTADHPLLGVVREMCDSPACRRRSLVRNRSGPSHAPT